MQSGGHSAEMILIHRSEAWEGSDQALVHLRCYSELVPLGDGWGYQTIPLFEYMPVPKYQGLSISQSRRATRRGLYIYIISFQIPANMFISYVLVIFGVICYIFSAGQTEGGIRSEAIFTT